MAGPVGTRAWHGHAALTALSTLLSLAPCVGAQLSDTVCAQPGMRTSRSGVASPPVGFGQSVSNVEIGRPFAAEAREARARGQELLPAFPPSAIEDQASQIDVTASPENQLLHLQLRERALLEDFGPDHPDIQSLQARLAVVRAHLEATRLRLEETRWRQAEQERIRTAAYVPPPAPAPIIVRAPEVVPPQVIVVVPPPPELKPPASDFAEGPHIEGAPQLLLEALPPSPSEPAASAPVVVEVAAPLPWIPSAGALALGFALQAVVLGLLFRQRVKTNPVRVEVINAAAPAPVIMPHPADSLPRQSAPLDDTGATPQEDAVFRQVLEQNLRLREEITELEGAVA